MSRRSRSKKQKQNLPPPKNTTTVIPSAVNTSPTKELHTIKRVEAEAFSGPLPPPRVLQEYENILHGSADRVIAMAERQSAHRMEMEKNVIHSDIKLANRGQIFGFSLVLIISLIGGGLIYIGKDIGGLITLVGGISYLISTFVGSSKKKTKNLETKKNLVDKSIM